MKERQERASKAAPELRIVTTGAPSAKAGGRALAALLRFAASAPPVEREAAPASEEGRP